MLYNFLDDSFTTYENVKTPKVTLQMPLMDNDLDISDWSDGISDGGTPIVKDNITPRTSKFSINNNEEIPVTTVVQNTTTKSFGNSKEMLYI